MGFILEEGEGEKGKKMLNLEKQPDVKLYIIMMHTSIIVVAHSRV